MANLSKRSTPSGRIPVLLLALAAVVLIAGFAVSRHHASAKPFSGQVAAMSASAQSQLFVVGSLAPLGSFDYETSPVLTRLAVLDRHADGSLTRGQISHDQAAEVLADGDNVFAIIAQATRACKPAAHSGKCTGDRHRAEQLLAEARQDAQAIPDYAPAR